MQFSDTSASKNGLIQGCELNVFDEYGRISGNAGLLATFTRNLNTALSRIVSLIMQADGRWQWDDNNHTDLSMATTNLVTTAGSEQQDYSLDVTHLKIERVEVKDADGNWHKLARVDQVDLYDQSLTDFLKTPGMPVYYDDTGGSIFLYPKPLASAVTESGGLKVFFQRSPSYFVTTDTTKVPGINTLYHNLLINLASRDYALIKQLGNAKALAELCTQGEQDLADSYALRNHDERPVISSRKRLYN